MTLPDGLLRQFVLYGLSGVVSLGVHLGTMTALIELAGIGAVAATAAGFATSIPVHFTIQRRVVFASTGHALRQFRTYVVVTLAAMALNTGLFALAYPATGFGYGTVQIAVTCIVFGLNFVVNRSVTFAERGRRD